MTARDFDPVLAAALRNELEALAGGAHDAPAARPMLHRPQLLRPQLWITVLTAAVLMVTTLGILHLTAPRSAPPAEPATAIADPLAQITDPEFAGYMGSDVVSLLQLSGTGPTSAPITIPAGVTSVRPLLSCTPDAEFEVGVGKSYSTGCSATTNTSFGDIPVEPGRRQVVLRIPAAVTWRMVVIATPGTTTFATLRVTPPRESPR